MSVHIHKSIYIIAYDYKYRCKHMTTITAQLINTQRLFIVTYATHPHTLLSLFSLTTRVEGQETDYPQYQTCKDHIRAGVVCVGLTKNIPDLGCSLSGWQRAAQILDGLCMLIIVYNRPHELHHEWLRRTRRPWVGRVAEVTMNNCCVLMGCPVMVVICLHRNL